jgi:hypothetical protein
MWNGALPIWGEAGKFGVCSQRGLFAKEQQLCQGWRPDSKKRESAGALADTSNCGRND